MDFDREHEAKEIVPGLILGGLRDLRQILAMEPEVLAPLDRLPGEVWESGFRGEILYYPITDLGVLPDEVLDKLVRDQLGENGRILIRRSGVLPEICVMLEAPNEELCAWYMEDVLSALERTGLYLGWRPELLD